MNTMVARTALLALLAVSAQEQGAAQTLADIPASTSPAANLQALPLSPERRVILESALKARNYQRAEELLVEDIERSPKSPELLKFLASVFFLDGKYLNTAVALKKAEALGPLDDRNRFTLALAYIILNHRDWARPELEKLAKSDPKNALYPYWLGRLDYDAMQFTSAVSNLQQALALDPYFMKVYDNLGLCFEALGKYEEAIKTYQEAIRLNQVRAPSSPWPPLNLGTLLIKLGRLEEAETSLRESLRYDPRFPQAHYQLGLLLEKQKKDSEAIQALRAAVALDPAYAEPHYVLGRIYRRRGETEEAKAAWNTFQKLKREKRDVRPH